MANLPSMCPNCLELCEQTPITDLNKRMKYLDFTKWEKVSEESKFSYGKATVGYAVFGPVGAVASIGGKKEVTYKCPTCGYTITVKE